MTRSTHTLNDRFHQFKLESHERPKHCFEYVVTGTGQFPYDMLRYDAAWPVSSQDAFNIGVGFHDPQEAYRGRRSIKLRSYRQPTIDRWSSFTWSVGFAAVMQDEPR